LILIILPDLPGIYALGEKTEKDLYFYEKVAGSRTESLFTTIPHHRPMNLVFILNKLS